MNLEKMRMESDSIGEMEVPADAYYGVQSLRAKENFPITGNKLHPLFIQNLAKIKKAAALTNRSALKLPVTKASAIVQACDEIIDGRFRDEFIVDAIQGGAGTSANMNMNEVIANRAEEILGGKKGTYQLIHPNDHVNMAQSTNDVIPTAGKLTALDLLKPLTKELDRLAVCLTKKVKNSTMFSKWDGHSFRMPFRCVLDRPFTAILPWSAVMLSGYAASPVNCTP